MADEAQHRNIAIKKDYDEKLPPITTDMTRLQQALLNIFDNAIDAIGNTGTILIATAYDEAKGRIAIKIGDTGPGIPKETLSRIFDPFYTTKSPKEGVGLGLSVSYGIVEQLGGSIGVESEEHKGATFTIHLPAAKRV